MMAVIIPPGGLYVDQSGPIVWGPPVPVNAQYNTEYLCHSDHLDTYCRGESGLAPSGYALWVGYVHRPGTYVFKLLEIFNDDDVSHYVYVYVYNTLVKTITLYSGKTYSPLSIELANLGANSKIIFSTDVGYYVALRGIEVTAKNAGVVSGYFPCPYTRSTPSTTTTSGSVSANKNADQPPPERELKNGVSVSKGYIYMT